MRVRICRSCRGMWSAWGEVEPCWAWPTTGTFVKTMTDEAAKRLKLCLCDPDKPEPRAKRTVSK
jgi:hypothetical protein